jgi:tetratricopeptide (TPR) repeat protein
MRANANDARAPYYLGNLLYDRRRHQEAIELWERATKLDPSQPITWRNLGFGYYNILHDSTRALHAFARARELAPSDARVLYEQDQLLKRVGEPLERRLAILEEQIDLVKLRDDLSVEFASLYNSTGNPDRALAVLLSRQFQPWEGGEGLVLSQYVRANLMLGQRALKGGDAHAALKHFETAGDPPHSLSEAKHLLMNLSMIDYWLGNAYAENGQQEKAVAHWQHAAKSQGDFQQMQVQSISDTTYWSAMALRQLGLEDDARALFQKIYDYGVALENQTPQIDYFATSLPTLLLFDEDAVQRQKITARFLQAQALLGLNETDKALNLLKQVRDLDRGHVGATDLLTQVVR